VSNRAKYKYVRCVPARGAPRQLSADEPDSLRRPSQAASQGPWWASLVDDRTIAGTAAAAGQLGILGVANFLRARAVPRLLRECRALVVPHSAGLLGPGSDVLGYDTERSTDHDWGPRCTVLVASRTWPTYAARS
jgi:hypothetical protein